MAELVVAQPGWWHTYQPWLTSFHPELWKEILKMAKRRCGEVDIDFNAVAEAMDAEVVVKAMGAEKFVKAMGAEEVIDALLSDVPPTEREELKRQLKAAKRKGRS